jgi:hypothetical protein
MSDNYYVKLVRCMLVNAEGDLQKAQEYAIEAGSEESYKRIQLIIDIVRKEVDKMGHELTKGE